MQAGTVPVITIDGPTASGKGTIAQLVAAALGWHVLDSGALYRLCALAMQQAGVGADDAGLAAGYARDLKVRFAPAGIYLDGQEVSQAIRQESTGNLASSIAAMPAVRAALLQRQRDFRQAPGLVADGRDMGTVVFPDAQLKIFLDASVQVRAERRHKQLIEKGLTVKITDLLSDLNQRDLRDRSRAHAPLVAASDAFVIDSSCIGIDSVVAKILDLWANRRS